MDEGSIRFEKVDLGKEDVSTITIYFDPIDLSAPADAAPVTITVPGPIPYESNDAVPWDYGGEVYCITGRIFDTMQSTLMEDLEIEKELKLINKAPVKTIYTKFGYILDCIDINNQPSLDHPLLKNHKLQKYPSFRTSKKTSSTKAILGIQKDECPIGTVPIKRTTKDDLIRGKSYFNNGLIDHMHGNHYAEVISGYFPYYNGVHGTSSIYNVSVTNDQSSCSVMYVRNGPDSTNYIGMGWHVAPELYNDYAPHVYIVWTV
ncbi:uncharacterized protein LOC127122107 [Lathyrus oleraceus]|uniref:uncharacterized protein LOC127122107 n=1 Tax=Pisum sativum TaxID=3888 RepID=UPI0021CFAACB|nr:uncharacterized protein LOC127122107 [Pisum sativum]